MPQHAPHRAPLVEFLAWLVSVVYRPFVPLGDIAQYYGLALVDAWRHRTGWVRSRLQGRWRWQASAAAVIVLSATVALVSTR